MRLCHETNKGLGLRPRSTLRTVNPDRTGCHPLAMDTNRPSLPGSCTEEVWNTWTCQGTRNFRGCEQPGAWCLSSARGSPSALIQKGDWCGSATSPSPSKRKPKVRVRLNIAFCDEENQRGLAIRRVERAIDQGQLNGDPFASVN